MSDQPKTDTASNVSQLPSKTSFKKIGDCRTLAEAFETKDLRDRIAATIPKHMDPDTMLRAFIQASTRSPLIFKCDMRQAIGAFMSLSYLGLVPGTILQHAHMIPFAFKQRWNPKTRQKEDGYDLQVIIGYPGLVDLAHRSGFVRDLQTGIVLPGEVFEAQKGTDKFLTHKPQLDVWNPSAIPRAAYAVASLIEGGSEFEVMSWGEVLAIRNRSQAYRRALAAKEAAASKGHRPPATWTEAPWVAHERQMGRKTALRRLATLLPKCPELRAGIGLDDAGETGKHLDYGTIIDGTATPMEGVPEVSDNPDDGYIDPGAAFSDRREEPATEEDDSRIQSRQKTDDNRSADVDQSASQQKPKTRATRQQPRVDTAPTQASDTKARPATSTVPDQTSQSSAKPPPATTPAAEQGFEAVLIDQHGEIIGDIHTDPLAFAQALVALCNVAPEGDAAEIIVANADSIDAARETAAAAAILDQLDEAEEEAGTAEEQDGDESAPTDSGDAPVTPLTYGPVRPPMSGDKPQWGQPWINLLRDELATVDPLDLLSWTLAQREVLAEAPLAHRALAVRSIQDRFQALGRTAPDYLTTRAQLTQPQKDQRWIDDLKAAIDDIAPTADGRIAFDAIIRSDATKTVMARLQRESPDMFTTARTMFVTKNEKLPQAPRTAE